MQRIYIEFDNARITRRGDDFRLDVELYSGERFENVEARRLFPTTGPNKYITLLDENGKETAVIRDLDTLIPESARRCCFPTARLRRFVKNWVFPL